MLLSLAVGIAVLLIVLVALSLHGVAAESVAGNRPWSPQGSVTLTRGPYLQAVTTDSIVIAWETDRASDSRVDYGLIMPELGRSVIDLTPVVHHAVTVTGLQSYTRYIYRVSSEGSPLGPASTFRTAAPPAQSAFSFVAFGDTRTDHAAHRAVVDRIEALAPDFALHTGDLVGSGSRAGQWAEFFAIEQDLMRQAPVFPVLGNHEGNHANYFDAFHLPGNERWYSFDYGSVHFIGLQVDGYASFAPESPQYEWLEDDVIANDSQWTIVFFHVPPYSSGPHATEATVLNARKTLHPLFVRHGVHLVLNGHDHDYERSVVNGITYVVAGAGGAPLYSRQYENPHSVCFTSTYHAVSVAVKENAVSAVGVRPDERRFDPFTLTQRADTASRQVIGPGLYTFGAVDARVDLGEPGALTELTATVAHRYPEGVAGVRFLPRVYTLAVAGGNGYSSTVAFRYRDADLHASRIGSEGGLRLYRYDASGEWQPCASTVDPAVNWITATAADLFSRWAIGEEREPIRFPPWLPVVLRTQS